MIQNKAKSMNMNLEFSQFTPVRYSSQVVNGTNYKIVYKIGNNQTILVQVYQPLPNSNAMP